MKNNYSMYETFKLYISFVFTKAFYKKARLIRLPVYIRGERRMQYGKGLTTGYGCRIESLPLCRLETKNLIIGKNCHMGDHVHISAGEKIIIGDDCLLASKIYISDISHGIYSGSMDHSNPSTPPRNRILHTSPVMIGDNVWIGDNVSVLPGVSIGSGSIIGANAVVNKNIPNDCIAVGVPAVVIKRFDSELKKWILTN